MNDRNFKGFPHEMTSVVRYRLWFFYVEKLVSLLPIIGKMIDAMFIALVAP